MLEWPAAHDVSPDTLINLGMLLVWVVYLHVFVSSYRRQTPRAWLAELFIPAGAPLSASR